MPTVNEMLDFAIHKLEKTAERVQGTIPNMSQNGRWNDESRSNPSQWTNGFWPGILWLMYHHTGDMKYITWANQCEDSLDTALDRFEIDHDVGFVWGLSSVNNYKTTGYEKSKIRALKAASSLAGRFNPAGNFIRAWNGPDCTGHAIIDCMMNLAILYWASEETKDARFKNIAIRHADTAAKEFIREDGSAYHIIFFDPETGVRTGHRGGQGYGDSSSWGRGTAWALHGFAISYQNTKDPKYLEVSQRVAKFFMEHLPENKVAPADFKAPADLPVIYDSTASAIAASGMALLYQLTGNEEHKANAITLLNALYQHCLAGDDEEALLLHGNVEYHAKDFRADVPIIYGDYYFLEALTRLADK